MLTSSDQTNRRALIAMTAVAFVLRLTAAAITTDIPGDGPARAMLAFGWAQSPRFITHGLWPPGLTYLAGLMCMVVPSPRIAPRLLNIILGTATIPLFYGVSRHLFGACAALLAAAFLMVLPLHIGLSASSLSEVPFVCVFFALLCVAFAGPRDSERPLPWIVPLMLLGILLELLRYEAWGLLPLVALYVAYRQRRTALGLMLLMAFLIFPLWWLRQSHLVFGDALDSFKTTMSEDGAPVPLLMAPRLLWRMVRNHVGALGTIIIVASGLSAALSVVRRKATAEQTLHLALVAFTWAILFGLTLRRGTAVWSRYFLLALTLTLPFAAAGVLRWIPTLRWQVAVGIAAVAFFAASYFTYRPTMWVTGRQFPDIHAFVAWRVASAFHNDAVLLTPLNWEATYVAFYAPDLAGRAFVVAPSERESDLREFYRRQRPRLLITRAEDVRLVHLIEQWFGCSIGAEHQIATIGQLQVFDIRHLEQCTSSPTDAT